MRSPSALPLFAAAIAFCVPAVAADLSRCQPGPRDNCVVDGDTIWLKGEKIRLAGIDTPELDGARCRQEREMAEAATERLVALLAGGPVVIQPQGKDRYGRTLAVISVGGDDVGGILVAEGLARPWAGKRQPWCPVAR